MNEPRIQHQVTDAGPPANSGVLNVVATLEQRPMTLNAKLICGQQVQRLSARTLCEKGRGATYRGQARELAPERRLVADLFEQSVVVAVVTIAGARLQRAAVGRL